MNGKYLVGAMIEAVIKAAVLVAIILFVVRTASSAYDFGYRVFADEPVSSGEGRTITVAVSEGDDIGTIAQMLEDKGLIRDAKLFRVQELLSAYHDDILPGIYDLNTAMKAEEMLQMMSTPVTEEESSSEEAPGEYEMEEDTGLYDTEEGIEETVTE